MSRYARQISVPEFGVQGQAKLPAARVVVIGAGGLAAPVLPYLVGAGVGRIDLVDPDVVELSNLHRQVLFREADLGRPKAVCAAENLAGLNTDCRIVPCQQALGAGNVAAICAGADVVLDCADSFAVSYILSDFCLAHHLPLISASVSGASGYAGGFCGGAPSLRAVFPDLPDVMGSCAEDGVLGPIVGIIGALQAQMAVAVLAGLDPSPLGQVTRVDGLTLRAASFRFDGAPEPEQPRCFIDLSQVAADDLIVDLRAPDEGPLAHPRAVRRVPDTPTPHARLVLCCQSGRRAWMAADRLATHWPTEITIVALGDANQRRP